jgi:hypothetical protein
MLFRLTLRSTNSMMICNENKVDEVIGDLIGLAAC